MIDKTIAGKWCEFMTTNIHPNTPDIQLDELKRTFYAGSQGVVILLFNEVTAESRDIVFKQLARELTGI